MVSQGVASNVEAAMAKIESGWRTFDRQCLGPQLTKPEKSPFDIGGDRTMLSGYASRQRGRSPPAQGMDYLAIAAPGETMEQQGLGAYPDGQAWRAVGVCRAEA